MNLRKFACGGAVVLALASISVLPVQGQTVGDSRLFPETGHTMSGKFRSYWEGHGGLAQQGYPISEEMQEKSDLNGQSYTVQYFERAVFEKHPENKAPYDVLLSQLGTFRYKQKYPTGAAGQEASIDKGRRLFPETGHIVGGVFRAYWESHGGLAQQGYPISDEFTEVSDLNGQPYTVQYFERAVFELHPENAPPFNVLLSQLGTFRYRQKYAAVPPTTVPLQYCPSGQSCVSELHVRQGQSFRYYDPLDRKVVRFTVNRISPPSLTAQVDGGNIYEFSIQPTGTPGYWYVVHGDTLQFALWEETGSLKVQDPSPGLLP